ncbi:MAG: C10 family peptidase [Bacteroidales bacterium]|nr:C10 family peptidase [Bacteroidales bacterium]
MKRLFLFFAITISCLSCEKSIETIPDEPAVLHDNSTRSLEEAKDLAIMALSMIESATKADAVSREIESCEIIGSVDTKSGPAGQDTLLYVFNFKNSAGFTVVSANLNDKTPVLGFSRFGSFKSDRNNVYMQEYLRYLSKKKEETGHKYHSIYREYEWVNVEKYIEVSPKIKYHWAQADFFGKFCPNGLAGCGPVAIGQIMAYYGYPDVITLSCDMEGYLPRGTNVAYDWEGMRRHEDWHEDNDVCTPYHDDVAALLREIGFRASANYYTDGRRTGSYTADDADAFESFGYETKRWPDTWNRPGDDLTTDVMKSVLDDGPVYMVGYTGSIKDRSTFGHAWVVDGYIQMTIKYRLEGSLPLEFYEDALYIHINWGWGGESDGWFRFGEYKGGEDEYNYRNLIMAVKPGV